ncbi:hypothetical protein LSH36_188g03060 [Paralvinella palmiformis]|uniref:Uncharacterized protein n=1 Tax=Paralvinella palmiformis TaxID=53620 RepID=A0AAD9JQZ4_9ANNE|nr:hypothetical protein LSH36_188g03060 [Paralvinella palmiformis]
MPSFRYPHHVQTLLDARPSGVPGFWRTYLVEGSISVRLWSAMSGCFVRRNSAEQRSIVHDENEVKKSKSGCEVRFTETKRVVSPPPRHRGPTPAEERVFRTERARPSVGKSRPAVSGYRIGDKKLATYSADKRPVIRRVKASTLSSSTT